LTRSSKGREDDSDNDDEELTVDENQNNIDTNAFLADWMENYARDTKKPNRYFSFLKKKKQRSTTDTINGDIVASDESVE